MFVRIQANAIGLLCAMLGMMAIPKMLWSKNWMHPDRYVDCKGYTTFMETCKSEGNWSRAELNTQIPNGQRVQLESLRASNEQGFFLHCDADMRWVVHSNNPLVNLSESLVQGFNGGALDFVLAGHLHSMGGYGLWRRHFDLIRFHGGPQAWQLVATSGEVPQIRDIDHTQAFYAGGKAIVFVDNIAAEGGYEASNYILYELDVVSRHWTRLGVVDARIGMFQEVHALEHGALVLNRAGEMVWLDFTDASAKLLVNRSNAFDGFRNWRDEVGRMTFYSDSSLWHVFAGEHHFFEVPWSELNEVASFPIAMANPVTQAELLVPARSLGKRQAMPSLLLASLAILVAVIVIAVLARTLLPSFLRSDSTNRSGSVPTSKGALSPLARKLVALEGSQFDTEELDDVLEISHLVSPETLRSQRARLLQRVNAEYRVKEGVDLVVRMRSPNDRRRSVYCIGFAVGHAANQGKSDEMNS